MHARHDIRVTPMNNKINENLNHRNFGVGSTTGGSCERVFIKYSRVTLYRAVRGRTRRFIHSQAERVAFSATDTNYEVGVISLHREIILARR